MMMATAQPADRREVAVVNMGDILAVVSTTRNPHVGRAVDNPVESNPGTVDCVWIRPLGAFPRSTHRDRRQASSQYFLYAGNWPRTAFP